MVDEISVFAEFCLENVTLHTVFVFEKELEVYVWSDRQQLMILQSCLGVKETSSFIHTATTWLNAEVTPMNCGCLSFLAL